MRLFIFIVFSAVSLSAEPISLEHALELIKKQNLELKAAEYALQSASYSVDMASSQDYGQLDFVQNISRSNDAGNVFGFKLGSREASFNDFGLGETIPPDAPVQALNYPDARNHFQSKLSYSLPLYTGNKITAYQNMAKAMRRISLLEKEEQLNTKVYETRKSYFDMALLKRSLENLSIIFENISRLEETTQEMISEGYAKNIDLLEVQSKKANVQRIIVELEANQELLYHYLSFLLNQEVSEITTPAYDLAEPQISAEEILRNSIDIQKAAAALQLREQMLVAEESRYLPTLGAMAEVQTSDDTFLADANDHKSYTVGLQFKWNLFSGGGDAAAIQKARVETLKMKTQSELARQGIALKVKEIQTKIQTANSEIKSLKSELSLSRQIYENYEGRYNEQLASMSDVIIKQSSWLENVLQLLKAENSRNTQIFALERLALIQGEKR
ncbi:MAG: TolC family protein [Campylobacterales bacterium]|nr:TolC family protein [Campylobacterales bacterium]